jgi:hypothetical protein
MRLQRVQDRVVLTFFAVVVDIAVMLLKRRNRAERETEK